MGATPIHKTKTSDNAWDGPEQVSNLETPLTKAIGDDTFAWVDPDADETTKAAWKFPHHFVTNHEPGAASTVACSAVVGALNGGRGGTTIPDADRKAVYAHVIAHLKDSGVEEDDLPELKSAAEVEATRAAGDDCSRCNGEGTVNLGGEDVTCPQCGGSGTGENNAPETQSANFDLMRRTGQTDPELRAARDEMRYVREERKMPAHGFEMREVTWGSSPTLLCTGYASATCSDRSDDSKAYEMEDAFGPWVESTVRGFATKSISENCDTAFLVNHGGVTMARTKPGTLVLTEDDNGLHYEARLNPSRPDVQILRAAVDDGNIDESSFAFRVTRQEWNEDYTRRWITEISLDKGDVSPVNFGASAHTADFPLGIRQRARGSDRASLLSKKAAIRRVEWLLAVQEARQGRVLSAENEAQLRTALDALHSTDDTDIPGIVVQLQAIDAAEDVAQAAIAAVLQVANPDGDSGDLEPALEPPDEDSSRGLFLQSDVSLARARAEFESMKYGAAS